MQWLLERLKEFVHGVKLMLTGKWGQAWNHAGKKQSKRKR
jgi:hypothetical protein